MSAEAVLPDGERINETTLSGLNPSSSSSKDPLLPLSSETTLTTTKEAFEPAFGGLTSVSWRAAMSIVTLRAVLMGWAVGMLVSAMNISFGLKTGWTQGGNIMAAVISMSFFKLIKPSKTFSTQEANVCQTIAASAGGIVSTASLVSGIPALKMLGYDYTYPALMLYAASVAVYGGFFALPLRTPLVVKEKLPFPSGTATYETIVAMASHGDVAAKRGRYLLNGGLASGAFALLSYFIPQLASPPILQNIGLNEAARFQWGFDLDPQLFGGGMMCGLKTGFSLLYGAFLGYALLGPIVDWVGWTPGPVNDYTNGVHGWLLWPGVTLMVMDSVVNLAFLVNWGKVFHGFRELFRPTSSADLEPLIGKSSSDNTKEEYLSLFAKKFSHKYWLYVALVFGTFVFLTTLILWHYYGLAL